MATTTAPAALALADSADAYTAAYLAARTAEDYAALYLANRIQSERATDAQLAERFAAQDRANAVDDEACDKGMDLPIGRLVQQAFDLVHGA